MLFRQSFDPPQQNIVTILAPNCILPEGSTVFLRTYVSITRKFLICYTGNSRELFIDCSWKNTQRLIYLQQKLIM